MRSGNLELESKAFYNVKIEAERIFALKKFAFIQPDGISITQQREDLKNELLNIYIYTSLWVCKKQVFTQHTTENIFFQASQLGRIAHSEILIIIVFRIPTFWEMQLKIL